MRFGHGLVALFAMAMPMTGRLGAYPLQAQGERFDTPAQGMRMPQFRGHTLDSAASWLSNHKLPHPRVTKRPSPDPSGIVLDQSPEAGQAVSPNTVVDLTVSSGPPPAPEDDIVTVPDLIGETRAGLVVRHLFSKLQFQDAGSITDDQNAGKVVRQAPEPGARIPRSTPIQLWFGRGTPVTVPDLQHNTIPEAEEILKQAGLQLGRVDSQPAPSEPGRIIRQRPAARQSASRGDRVRVWFGYASTVQVPDLRDSTVEGASGILQQAGLKLGEVQRVPTPTGTGRVASQQPLAQDAVARGTAVSVIVQEAAPVTVPNVVGMQVSHAADVLKGAGLVASPVDSAESMSPAHTVLVQRPRPGTSVARGSSVYIQIAILSQFVPVPAVTNQTPDRARSILEGVGLRLGSVTLLLREGGSGLITSQGPVESSKVVRGTSVAVWVAVPIPPDTVPNVVDSTEDGAAQVLRAAGLTLGAVRYQRGTAGDSTVVEQHPTAGSLVPHLSIVNLVVAVSRQIPPPPPPPLPTPPPRPVATVPDVVRLPIATAQTKLQGVRLRPQRFDTASGVASENGVVLRQEPAAGQGFPGDSVVRLWVGSRMWPALWLIVLGSLAGMGAATATVKTVKQVRRDKEWRRRLTFQPRQKMGTPRIPETTNPLARPELELIPRAGTVKASVVDDGPLIGGEPR
jgi:beta-lactam-binding protein with PASTA domain